MSGFAVAFVLTLAGLLPICAGGRAQAEDVDVALVLVSDVSRSIDDQEYQLEKNGYVRALGSQQIVDAIQSGPIGKIAVAYVEFSGEAQTRTVMDWTIIHDAASARAFATTLVESPRSFSGRTAIGAGIVQALQLLAEAGVKATHRVIDVCGDGTSNAGPEVTEARDKALGLGIVINGLAIINESSSYAHVQPPGGLAQYYRDNVTGGPNSFVTEVRDFSTIGEAMMHKLLSEIAMSPDQRKFVTNQAP